MKSRRRFLADTGRVSLAAWAASGQAYLAYASESGNPQLQILTRAARLVFPHDRLPDAVYAGIVGELLLDPELAPVLNSGVLELGDFLSAADEAQISRLTAIEKGEFFETLQLQLRLALYRTPELWELIGYPGPSFPVGYAERGFDDIDWLPAR
jgi:hypothetical protein